MYLFFPFFSFLSIFFPPPQSNPYFNADESAFVLFFFSAALVSVLANQFIRPHFP